VSRILRRQWRHLLSFINPLPVFVGRPGGNALCGGCPPSTCTIVNELINATRCPPSLRRLAWLAPPAAPALPLLSTPQYLSVCTMVLTPKKPCHSPWLGRCLHTFACNTRRQPIHCPERVCKPLSPGG
jgi:hypothetical protein